MRGARAKELPDIGQSAASAEPVAWACNPYTVKHTHSLDLLWTKEGERAIESGVISNGTKLYAAPVAQEPVAFLCRECDEEGWSTYVVMPNERPCPSDLMHVTPLYAAPVAVQAQPSAQDREGT